MNTKDDLLECMTCIPETEIPCKSTEKVYTIKTGKGDIVHMCEECMNYYFEVKPNEH